jgi:hypothetical protein
MIAGGLVSFAGIRNDLHDPGQVPVERGSSASSST